MIVERAETDSLFRVAYLGHSAIGMTENAIAAKALSPCLFDCARLGLDQAEAQLWSELSVKSNAAGFFVDNGDLKITADLNSQPHALLLSPKELRALGAALLFFSDNTPNDLLRLDALNPNPTSLAYRRVEQRIALEMYQPCQDLIDIPQKTIATASNWGDKWLPSTADQPASPATTPQQRIVGFAPNPATVQNT